MPSVAGRKVLVFYTPPNSTEEVALGALKSKSISFSKEGIDTTTDDDNGFRSYLSDVDGTRSCSIKASGLLKNADLLVRIRNEEMLSARFLIPGVLEVAGSFKFTTAENSNEMEDAASIDYTFESSGAFTLDDTPTP
jgi:predicted secreted protein